MKKLLALLLVVAMVCGAFVPAFAATEAEMTAEAKLLELGIMNDDRADDSLTRAEMVVLLSRLLGEEAAAKDFPVAPSFADATGHWGANYIAWAESMAYVQGNEDGTFAPDAFVTSEQMELVLNRALGYADGEGVAIPVTGEFTRGAAATMIVYALDLPMADGSQTLAAKLGMVAELAIVSAEQTDTDEMTVTFNQAVTEGTFSVMRGKVATAVEEVEFDGATATLTMEREIRDGFDYTIAFGDLEAVVAGQNSVVTTISFPYDYANMVSYADSNVLVVYYDVEDQFGNDVTDDNDVTFYSIGTPSVPTHEGSIELTTTNTWLMGTPVVVNGVYNDGEGVVVTAVKTFEIAGPIKLAELALGAPMNLGEETADIMKGQDFGTDDEEDFYWVLPLTALNQYGDQVPAGYFDVDENDDDLLDYFTQNGVEVVDVVEYEDALYAVLAADEDETEDENTTAFVTVIDLNSGLNDSITFIIPKAGVSEFKAIGPADEVIGGETVEIEFEAYDYYGNEITDEDDLADVKVGSDFVGTETDVDAGDRWAFATDSFTDAVTLEYKADDNDSAYATPVFFTFTVENTASVSQLNFSVSENRKPIDIQGFDDTDLLYASGAAGEVDVADLIFIDQYGDDMEYGDLPDGYTVSIEDADEDDLGTTFAVVTVEADDYDYTAYLMEEDEDDAVAEFEFTVEVIDVSDIDEFTTDEITVMYADENATDGSVATKYMVEVELTGEYNGKEVVLPTDTVLELETYPSTNLVDTAENMLGAFGLEDDEDEDVTAVVLIKYSINGDEETGVFERTVELSGVVPTAETLEVVLNEDDADFDLEISGNVVKIDSRNLSNGMDIAADDDQDEPFTFYFEATDQYDVVTDEVFSYFYVVEDGDNDSDFGTYDVNQAGTLEINNTMQDGDVFTITAVTESGLTQTIEVEVVVAD